MRYWLNLPFAERAWMWSTLTQTMNSHEDAEANWVERESLADSKPRLNISTSFSSSAGQDSPVSGSDSPASSVQSPPTPLPQTPLFSPQSLASSSSSSPSKENNEAFHSQEIPEALFRAGWRKCWSQRENRFYFFNKLTQQSQWDMPDLEGRKRRLASGADSQEPYKKFIPSTDWDLSVASNVKMHERVPLSLYPPHPDIELKRAEAVHKLHQTYQELCHGKDGVETPAESLQRWLMERKLRESGRDPLLSSETDNQVSPSMLRDLLNCVPVRFQKMQTIPEARKQMGRYAEAARRLVETSRHISSEQRKQIKWQCEAMFDWLRHSHCSAKFEEYVNRMKFLRSQCQATLVEAARPSAESVCARMSSQAREMALRLQEEHRQLLLDADVNVAEYRLPPPRTDKLVNCYSSQLRFATPRLPTTAMEQSPDNWVRLRYRQHAVKLHATHFFKLEQLYRYNCFDDRKFDLFLARVWSMIKRQQCLYGPNPHEGSNLQKALPISVFECLKRDSGVSFECFASPLNCYFRQFCSLFPDCDGYFGSRGSFLEFHPLEGSLCAHPPFCEEILTATAQHILNCLREAEENQRCLSVVVVLPEIQDPPLEASTLLESEPRFLKKKLLLAAFEHFFRHGSQQWLASGEEVHVRGSTGTVVRWMQTTMGAGKWPVDEDAVQRLRHAFLHPCQP